MSFLKNIFGKKEAFNFPPLHDYAAVVTDIHSHLIPGIDDGSQSMEDSLALIRSYKELGFKKLVTTPHVMSDSYRNTPEIILGGLEQLRAAVAAEGLDMEVQAAAEYYFDEQLPRLIETKNILAINDKYLLFEISYMNPPDNIAQVVFDMNLKGYTPLLAHPERYPFWYNRFEEYYKLKDAGVLFQINTISLVGYYGPVAKKIAERMINEKMVDFIGSDMHGDRHMAALKHCLAEKYLWKLVSEGVRNSSL
jgi:tyrosine-protein phosphatase YwqE